MLHRRIHSDITHQTSFFGDILKSMENEAVLNSSDSNLFDMSFSLSTSFFEEKAATNKIISSTPKYQDSKSMELIADKGESEPNEGVSTLVSLKREVVAPDTTEEHEGQKEQEKVDHEIQQNSSNVSRRWSSVNDSDDFNYASKSSTTFVAGMKSKFSFKQRIWPLAQETTPNNLSNRNGTNADFVSEFRQKSKCISESDQLWRQFRSELGANHITTAAGVQAMLTKFVTEQMSDEDLDREDLEDNEKQKPSRRSSCPNSRRGRRNSGTSSSFNLGSSNILRRFSCPSDIIFEEEMNNDELSFWNENTEEKSENSLPHGESLWIQAKPRRQSYKDVIRGEASENFLLLMDDNDYPKRRTSLEDYYYAESKHSKKKEFGLNRLTRTFQSTSDLSILMDIGGGALSSSSSTHDVFSLSDWVDGEADGEKSPDISSTEIENKDLPSGALEEIASTGNNSIKCNHKHNAILSRNMSTLSAAVTAINIATSSTNTNGKRRLSRVWNW